MPLCCNRCMPPSVRAQPLVCSRRLGPKRVGGRRELSGTSPMASALTFACGCRLFGPSCDLRILMDQPTESILSHDASSQPDDR
jgi:hypothetical protein